MNLSQFVKTTLVEIMQGVRDAQDEGNLTGGIVNPALDTNAGDSSFQMGQVTAGHHTYLVDFDVAVSSNEGSEIGAGISVVSIFSAKASGKAESSEQSTSRVRFKVPVAFPIDRATKLAIDNKLRLADQAVREGNAQLEP